ncbi:2-isopropylmalate synthase [Starmerella bacillaris]|uniref:2-isopropylmalate synthase n=1 Tax=Starmerella bacillaris TaxID=1247836 RepID=A0AAV5RJ84_STABA|nr:2-isopropylmalate synthase [Starmerella bacillaris]
MTCPLSCRAIATKYKPFPPINLPNRKWPSRVITKAPRWLATDLRDGNQSLPDPMNFQEKKEYFDLLCKVGYKEIEVAFPSASQIDFDFTRYAVENAPADVAIQVLSPCREALIRRTIESLKGAKKAIVHIYLAASPLFRDVVFNTSEEQYLSMATKSAKLVRELTKDNPDAQDTQWQFEFSPETFSDTPLDFSLRVCEEVKKAWEPTVENPIIFNLPATVEMSTPNVFADQVEYISTNISEREKVCISLHCHNDRGCAVAASELGQMAGADRIEGCLFGNGERTGNVDLVTLGLNLFTQGIDPKIDFSNLEKMVEVSERLNKIPVHPRSPYGGSLVVCAFSGSHQDAIKKGFARRNNAADPDSLPWQIPYLPLDPGDVGRTYEAVIRVNSQSGKGGAAWIILRKLELDLPRGLQVNFSKHVQDEAEFKDRELLSDEITDLFERKYFLAEENKYPYSLVDYEVTGKGEEKKFQGTLNIKGEIVDIEGVGNGPISSFMNALENYLGYDLDVEDYHEHSLGKGSATKAVSYLQIKHNRKGSEEPLTEWGVGIDKDVSRASMKAALSVVNRILC